MQFEKNKIRQMKIGQERKQICKPTGESRKSGSMSVKNLIQNNQNLSCKSLSDENDNFF